jgi:prepilin-type N-terminal cleavage/methylation domain-containing protein
MAIRTDRPHRGASAARAAGGFTLLELLVVLGLFAVLFGISVGLFKKVGMGRAQAVAQVKDAIRAARTFAIEQSATATVDFDVAGGRVIASGFVSVGNWHFEDDRSAGWPTDADLTGGATIVDDGAIGRALKLSGDSRGFVTLGRSPSFDPDQGVLIDLFLRVPAGTDAPLVSKGKAYALSVTSDDGIAFTVRAREGGMLGKSEGELRSIALSRCFRPDRWSRVQASYDGRRMLVVVDGREFGRREFDSRLTLWPDPESPLMVGGPEDRFDGEIDELRLASTVINEAPPLPDGVKLDKPESIHFGPNGRLDPMRHAAPARVALVIEDGNRRREVVVGMFGEIQ